MKKSGLLSVLFPLIYLIILAGCGTLSSVGDFSSASVSGIKKFEDINYSFRQHCNERCSFEAVRSFEFKRDPDCDCADYIKADQVTQLIYNTLKSYFTGLSNLSDNKYTSFNFKNLEKSLVKGDFGSVSINDDHVEACTNLSGIILSAATDLYRRNRIKEYIGEANSHVQILLEKFRFIIQQNLKEELDFKKEKLFAYYMEMKMGNTLSDYEKGKAASDYYEQIAVIRSEQEQMATFAKSLITIAEGHQELYDNRNKVSAKEIAIRMAGYASDIQDIISEFNKFKD
jgi:hypothetical protein